MRNTHWLGATTAFTVAVLLGTQTVEAQMSVHVGSLEIKPVSFPFTVPIRTFDGDQKSGTDPLTAADWDSTFEPSVKQSEAGALSDLSTLQVSDELIIPPAPLHADSSEAIILEEMPCPDKRCPEVKDCEKEEDCAEEEDKRRSLWELATTPYSVYRTERQNLTWITGSGDDFGMVNWSTDCYLPHDEDSALTSAFNVHWLSGPTTVPLQSRVFDFVWAYQKRGDLSSAFSYDISASAGVYSDFEASAREGVRFPSHAVGMFHCRHGVDFVFGIDYLDRDDISLLPVIGLSLSELAIDGLRLDLVFPRPRINYTFSDQHRMYLAGELGGGSWDVELQGIADTVATYRDYRIVLGFESANKDGSLSALEFGYVFDRTLEFRGSNGDTGFGDAFMINLVSRK